MSWSNKRNNVPRLNKYLSIDVGRINPVSIKTCFDVESRLGIAAPFCRGPSRLYLHDGPGVRRHPRPVQSLQDRFDRGLSMSAQNPLFQAPVAQDFPREFD